MDKGNISAITRNQGISNDAEINLVQLIAILINHWRWIAICTASVMAVGFAYSLFATPVYYSQAVLALKESKGSNASNLFSQFGGIGGMVASQMGLGSTNLEKIEVLIKGHELTDSVIRRYDLLPILFPDLWDGKNKTWLREKMGKEPIEWRGRRLLLDGIMAMHVDIKKNLIQIGAYSTDPVLAKRFVDCYTEELNNKIRTDVREEAEGNRRYLEDQLNYTSDPVLIQKIQSMIGMEVEKYMIVSSRALDILDPPVVAIERSKPKRKMIVVLSILFGLILSIVGAIFRAILPGVNAARKINWGASGSSRPTD